MIKLKTTERTIKQQNIPIIRIGYCDAHYLLSGIEPFAYTEGVFGWKADFYEWDNVIISTGYQPIGESVNFALLENYERKAEKIVKYNEENWQTKKQQCRDLLTQFIQELKER